MALHFPEIGPGDGAQLAEWLPRHTWPYHAHQHVDATWVLSQAATGYFFGAEVKSFWVRDDGPTLGLVRVFELNDVTPLLDLRIGEAHRGRGAGTETLRWVTQHLFETAPEMQRLGGYTRYDNVAMRRAFEKCGFVQEARHRRAWRVENGELMDAVGYAILRSDWSTGTTTSVGWPYVRSTLTPVSVACDDVA